MKLSNYNYIFQNGGYSYWYNALSDSYFRLSKSTSDKVEGFINDLEYNDSNSAQKLDFLTDKLKTGGFIIDDEINELDIIRDNYNKAIHDKAYKLVVLPTINCNFKCWYCIQDHRPSLMSAKVFESTKRHIDYMIYEKKISALHLDWFGGEPFMYFDKVIKPLSEYAIRKCADADIPFVNGSTTNGHFINEDMARELKPLKFRGFQITLDGEKEFHDKVKFMHGCESAFDTVLSNIRHILEYNDECTVHLRINYTHSTFSSRIVDQVSERIPESLRKRTVITPKKVWQEKVDKDFDHEVLRILDMFEKQGFLVFRREFISNFIPCYVNREFYNTINFNGNALKCTACDDIRKDKTEGQLQSDGTIIWEDDFDKKCQEPSFENEECLTCKKLPLCMGLCPRDFLAGRKHCKEKVGDTDFETRIHNFILKAYETC